MSRPTQNRGQHVVAIDLIRFIAAALVLITHLAFDIQNRPESIPYNLSIGSMPHTLWPGLSFYGWIGVQIFFVISGIVITYSADGSSTYYFFRSRMLRLVPAAWLSSSLTLIFLYYHHGSLSAELMRGYRHSLLFIPWAPWISDVFWTLSIEISFYLAIGLLIYKQQLERICALAIYLTWISLAYWIIFSITEYNLSTYTLIHIGDIPYWADRVLTLLLIKHGCFFAAGIYICAALIKHRTRPAYIHIAAMLSACFLQIYWHTVNVNGPRNYPYWPGAAIFAISVAAIIAGIRYNNLLCSNTSLVKAIRLLGLMTYPLYLLHQSIGSIVIGKLRILNIQPVAAFCFACLFVLFLSWIVVTYAEPILKHRMGSMLDLWRSRLVQQNTSN